MSTFSDSTQARFWLFTPAALAAAREQRHLASLSAPAHATSSSSSSSSSAPATAAAAAAPAAGHKRTRPTEDDTDTKRARSDPALLPGLAAEQTLLDWCSLALQRMCCMARLDRAVTATAHAYLRRFYVRGLLTQYPPHEMLCVWGGGAA